MRNVDYTRYEFHQDEPEGRHSTLAEFVLDVPWLLVRGVVPPLHLLNEILATGGGDAGMSPGTGWQPFQISAAEYRELVDALRQLDLELVDREERARFVPARIIIDESLHACGSHPEWLERVRAAYAD